MPKVPHFTRMKNTYLALCLSAVTLASVALFAADKPNAQPSNVTTSSHETITTEVLKVFTAKDGNAVFRAYLVKWKDQEVIASDPLASSNYKVGDKINVLAMNHSHPRRGNNPNLLAFQVIDRP